MVAKPSIHEREWEGRMTGTAYRSIDILSNIQSTVTNHCQAFQSYAWTYKHTHTSIFIDIDIKLLSIPSRYSRLCMVRDKPKLFGWDSRMQGSCEPWTCFVGCEPAFLFTSVQASHTCRKYGFFEWGIHADYVAAESANLILLMFIIFLLLLYYIIILLMLLSSGI
jgi:hypothetical protein